MSFFAGFLSAIASYRLRDMGSGRLHTRRPPAPGLLEGELVLDASQRAGELAEGIAAGILVGQGRGSRLGVRSSWWTRGDRTWTLLTREGRRDAPTADARVRARLNNRRSGTKVPTALGPDVIGALDRRARVAPSTTCGDPWRLPEQPSPSGRAPSRDPRERQPCWQASRTRPRTPAARSATRCRRSSIRTV